MIYWELYTAAFNAKHDEVLSPSSWDLLAPSAAPALFAHHRYHNYNDITSTNGAFYLSITAIDLNGIETTNEPV
eukprot:UN06495